MFLERKDVCMVDTISSIVINIISSFLYDGMNGWKEKKQIENFKDEMTEWVQNFEQKNDFTSSSLTSPQT